MLDISKRLGISKKTLYEIIKNKEELIMLLIEESRSNIKEQQSKIYNDNLISNVEKLKKILTVIPKFHMVFNYRFLEEIKIKYPKIYKIIIQMFESDWDNTFKIFKKAIKNKEIRNINCYLFKKIYINSIISLYEDAKSNSINISYKQGLEEIVSILFNGIIL